MAEMKEEKLAEDLSITGDLKATIYSLSQLHQKFGGQGYAKLTVREVRDCGHPFHCECTPGLALFGQRPQKG